MKASEMIERALQGEDPDKIVQDAVQGRMGKWSDAEYGSRPPRPSLTHPGVGSHGTGSSGKGGEPHGLPGSRKAAGVPSHLRSPSDRSMKQPTMP